MPLSNPSTSPDRSILIISYSGSFINLPNAQFTRVPFNNISIDSSGGWNAANNLWTVPFTGAYAVSATFRLNDDTPLISYGMDVNISQVDTPDFLWGSTNTGLVPDRNGLQNNKIRIYAAGQQLRMFCFIDSNQPVQLIAASMSILKL